MTSRPSTTLVSITFSVDDVESLADELGIDSALAFERAAEWAKHVEATAATLVNEQMASVIESGQP